MAQKTSPYIIGNWKATPKTKEEAISFVKKLEKKITASKIKLPKKSYFLAVPEVFIPILSPLAKHGYIGSQTIHGIQEGQETGATTVSQLLSGGATFSIVGHSEVRKRGETQLERKEKVRQALAKKMRTILCFGEHTRDKEGRYLEELEHDVKQTLEGIPRESLSLLIVAYEPVWAIGASQGATSHECFEAVIALRRALASLAGIEYAKKVHVVYGGTVTKETVTSFLEEGGVNGLLVGRSSQEITSFFSIIEESFK